MKRIAPLLVLSTLVLLTATAWAQGPLSPPGAPGQTMKSLAQIEPRTPIESLPYTISTPGSYYLAGNLTGVSGNDGIVIQADNVSVDLMGFTLSGTSGAQSGIRVWGAYAGIAIRNGFIRGWPYSGVDGATANRGVYEKLDVSENGANGLSAGTLAVVRDCNASANVMRGINAGQGSRVESCQALTNAWGIYAADDVEIKGCQAENNTSVGILAQNNGQVTGNICKGNGVGLRLTGEKNYIAENTVLGNSQNYDLAQGNQLNILLGEVPETIAWPASVKFAGTLRGPDDDNTGCIIIRSSHVTIDLDGHSLIGIYGCWGFDLLGQDAPLEGVTIRNGSIFDCKLGIEADNVQGARFENLIFTSNNWAGIRMGLGSHGCTIAHCTFTGNGADGGIGLYGDTRGNAITDCTFYRNAGYAIALSAADYVQCNDNTIANCTITENGNGGISLYRFGYDSECDGNSIVGCTLRNNLVGIAIVGATGTRLDGNHISGQTGTAEWGIHTQDATNNLIVRNTCVGAATNFGLSPNDTWGPIVTTTGELSTSGADANPWANFSR